MLVPLAHCFGIVRGARLHRAAGRSPTGFPTEIREVDLATLRTNCGIFMSVSAISDESANARV